MKKMEERIKKFRDKGLGLFVHYGPYVQFERGEWFYKNQNQMNLEEYEKKAMEYDYSSFDANGLVKAAKAAGARYITFTTRHHDGFSLYDTKGLTDYDIMHTKNGRDIVREFVDACHENDIMPFLYHTTLDWHNTDFNNNFAEYQKYLRESIQILCQNYGEIGGFWLDGNWSKPAGEWELDELYSFIRRYQPEAIIINNTGLDAPGVFGHREIDCVTFEQGTPQALDCSEMEKVCIGEMCYPLCKHWGIAKDINIKSMKEILEAFLSARKVGGNFLLGVYAKVDGNLTMLHQGYLEALGSWIKTHETALFDTEPCEIQGMQKDFVLKKMKKIYIFVHEVGTSGDANVMRTTDRGYAAFLNVTKKVSHGRWMNNGDPVVYTQDLENQSLFIEPTMFQYGEAGIVRVAEFDIEEK